MVAVGVDGHHDDGRLGGIVEGVAPDGEVALPGDVGHGVVEVEDDVAAPGAEGDHAAGAARQCLGALVRHRLRRVVGRGLWQRVDKLSRGRAVFVDGLDVFALGCGLSGTKEHRQEDSQLFHI